MDDAGPEHAGLDEELPHPHRERTRAQRLRRDLGLATAILAVIALVANAMTHKGGTRDTLSRSSASSAPSIAVPTGVVALTPTGAAYLPPTAADALKCPDQVECITAHDVSTPIREAIAAAFPGATITSAESVRQYVRNYGQANQSLRIAARDADIEITVSLRGLAQSDRTRGYSRMLYGGRAITRYEDALGHYHVLIEVVTAADQYQPADPLARLASDIRLFEPW